MAENHQQTVPAVPEFYEIRVKGHLDNHWSAWFDGMAVTREENGETTLAGPILDQPALYGVLIKVRDLGLPLLSVKRTDPQPENGTVHLGTEIPLQLNDVTGSHRVVSLGCLTRHNSGSYLQ